MHAHMAIAALPVEFQVNRVANRRERAAIRDAMQDLARFAVAGVHDLRAPRGPAHGSRVARLAAAQRIKNRPIDGYRLVTTGDDHGVAFLQVGILAKEFVRHLLAPTRLLQCAGNVT